MHDTARPLADDPGMFDACTIVFLYIMSAGKRDGPGTSSSAGNQGKIMVKRTIMYNRRTPFANDAQNLRKTISR